jgi:uncharacterized DUF497 family protein
MDRVAGFDWDEGNRRKCQKHGVSIAEIEGLFWEDHLVSTDVEHSGNEPRARAVGRTTSGRHVFVVFTVRERQGRRFIRPISARYMHRKEISRYEETKS